MAGYDYDLFVIGGGSGGVRAARIAAGFGARTGIAESSRFGGTCVIRGCVPKKLLVYASRFADEFGDAAGFGWRVPPATFDWTALISAKDQEIARLEGIYEANLLKAGVTLHRTRAELVGPQTLRLVDEGRTVTAERILVATGCRPQRMPDLPGSELAITSDDIFHLPRLPERIVVVGGGYIAVEFACLLHGLGSRTTLVYRGDEILRGFDDDLRRALRTAMQQRGIEVVLQCLPRGISRGADALWVELSDGRRLAADQVLLAVGRTPSTAGLGLESAGVELGRDGSVRVDACSRSSTPGIFAVGDVTNRVNLTPAAIREGQAFAESEFGGRPTAVDHALVPTGVFTTPELGTVGLTEAQARERHGQVLIYKSEFRPLKATLSGSRERVLMKLVVDGATDRVLGAHMLGADAGETAQLLAIALRLGVTKADLDATLAVHPTAAEEWVTMKGPMA
ncbi:MAG: glutathione-disulfide reductase [Sinimarinibacterium sp.]|jgi:glutathione reductase (NADPH)